MFWLWSLPWAENLNFPVNISFRRVILLAIRTEVKIISEIKPPLETNFGNYVFMLNLPFFQVSNALAQKIYEVHMLRKTYGPLEQVNYSAGKTDFIWINSKIWFLGNSLALNTKHQKSLILTTYRTQNNHAYYKTIKHQSK